MFKNVVFRILAGLVLLAAIAGIAFFAYNAGVTQGTTVNVQAPAAQGQVVPVYGYGMPFAPFHPFFGFGCFGVLIPLFLLFLAFAAMRHLIWGPRMMMGDHHERFARHLHNRWGEDGVPPFFAELHRRAHAQPQPPADDAAKK
ncbi:MAG: hypothetical protein WA821_01325 [Anaerolineales bacterium]